MYFFQLTISAETDSSSTYDVKGNKVNHIKESIWESSPFAASLDRRAIDPPEEAIRNASK